MLYNKFKEIRYALMSSNLFFLITTHFQIVEFIAVLLKAGNQAAEEELVNSGTIKRVVDLFFEWVTSAPFLQLGYGLKKFMS